jgi:hypothetical protein
MTCAELFCGFFLKKIEKTRPIGRVFEKTVQLDGCTRPIGRVNLVPLTEVQKRCLIFAL